MCSQVIDLHKQLLLEYKRTFGQYDEIDITFPLWLNTTKRQWPW